MENKENENKYKAQIKYRKNNLKQFNIDFRFDTFNTFADIDKTEEFCKFHSKYY